MRYFLEVARTGSIQEASKRLHVAGSAISRQIASLETALGVALFVRLARGMALTAAGEALALHARRTALDAQRVIHEISALKGERGGKVRISSTEGFIIDFLPRALADFQSRRPEVSVELRMAARAMEVASQVREGEADLGLAFSRIAEKGVAAISRHRAPIMAMMRAGHALAGARRVSLSRLQEYPLALPSEDNTLRQLIELAGHARRLTLRSAFSSTSAQALLAYVLQGDAVTFTAAVSARSYVDSGLAVLVPISDSIMAERHVELQVMSGRTLPPFIAELAEDLQRRLGSA